METQLQGGGYVVVYIHVRAIVDNRLAMEKTKRCRLRYMELWHSIPEQFMHGLSFLRTQTDYYSIIGFWGYLFV